MEHEQARPAPELGLRVRLDVPFDQAIERVTAALSEEGFGVLSTIDVDRTLREKIGVEIGGYTILGACNPQLAYRALQADKSVGLLLPCNVIVYEEDEQSVVSIIDPERMLSVADPSNELKDVADEARAKLQRVAASLM